MIDDGVFLVLVVPANVTAQEAPDGSADSEKVVFIRCELLHDVDPLKIIFTRVPAVVLPLAGDGEYIVVQFEEEFEIVGTEYANVPVEVVKTMFEGALADLVIPSYVTDQLIPVDKPELENVVLTCVELLHEVLEEKDIESANPATNLPAAGEGEYIVVQLPEAVVKELTE